jgi:hypothetical protein
MAKVDVLTLALMVACTSGCASSASPVSGGRPVDSPSSSGPPGLQAPLFASPTGLSLPASCAPTAVGAHLATLVSSVNARDSAAVVSLFAPGFLWEVNEHMDPPNGTAGGLRTPADITAFLGELRGRRERWTEGSLVNPVGSANLPEQTGYGFGFSIVEAGRSRAGGGKVVIDCVSGRIIHMVGPTR